MKKNGMRRGLALMLAGLLLMLGLSGCDYYDLDLPQVAKQNVQNVEDGRISGRRTGIIRQGISGQFKSYECTDDQVYFMVNVDGRSILYSMKHDENVLQPLCGEIGCEHTDETCSAWYGINGNICYYEENLFVSSGTKLYRMNLDGTDRGVVFDIETEEEIMKIGSDAITNQKLWNGIWTFELSSILPSSDAPLRMMWTDLHYWKGTPVTFFYKLDESMSYPQEMSWISGETGGVPVALYNDGAEFLMLGRGRDEEHQGFYLHTWKPNGNTFQWFADVTNSWVPEYGTVLGKSLYSDTEIGPPWGNWSEAYGEGYWGKDRAFYLQTRGEKPRVDNNLICELNYASGKSTVLVDTGLEGSYRLCCFPDCLVLVETMNNFNHVPDAPRMQIYNWKMELLADGQLPVELSVLPQDMICGETANRIYLAEGFIGVPEYYIEKDELKSGEITLHELTYEGLDLKKARNDLDETVERIRAEKMEELWAQIPE